MCVIIIPREWSMPYTFASGFLFKIFSIYSRSSALMRGCVAGELYTRKNHMIAQITPITPAQNRTDHFSGRVTQNIILRANRTVHDFLTCSKFLAELGNIWNPVWQIDINVQCSTDLCCVVQTVNKMFANRPPFCTENGMVGYSRV